MGFDMSDEVWADIKGFDGKYQVSNKGNVRRLNGRRHACLSLGKNTSGYLQVKLYGSGFTRHAYVHHLVLEAFVSSRPIGLEACHNDGNRTNNDRMNLRWDTRANNCFDRKAHGTENIGERHGASKLTSTQVIQMRNELESGMSQRMAAKKFGVSQSTVRDIAHRKKWAHL